LEYVRKTPEGFIQVCEDQEVRIVDLPLSRYLQTLALRGLSTLKGRLEAVRKVLAIKAKIPVPCDRNTLLFPLRGLRSDRALYLNYHAVSSYHKHGEGQVVVMFHGGHQMLADGFDSFQNSYLKAKCVAAYLKEQ